MPNTKDSSGFNTGLLAFLLWGLIPLYFKLLSHVPPLEILGHRVFWSFLILLGLLTATKQLKAFAAIFRQPKTMAMLAVTAILICP